MQEEFVNPAESSGQRDRRHSSDTMQPTSKITVPVARMVWAVPGVHVHEVPGCVAHTQVVSPLFRWLSVFMIKSQHDDGEVRRGTTGGSYSSL